MASYQRVNAWQALDLIDKWDAAPLLCIVRECVSERPCKDAIIALDKHCLDITWSHAELKTLLNDLVYVMPAADG